MSFQSSLECPRCGQLDSVRKVSSIVTEGISVGEYETHVPLQVGDKTLHLPVKKDMSSSTLLAKRLMPPEKPKKKKITRFDVMSRGERNRCWWTIALMWTIVAVAYSSSPLLGIAVAVAEWLVMIVRWKDWFKNIGKRVQLAQREADRAIPRWEPAIARWDKLYYCSRDDGVFIPGEGRFVPVDQMTELLYAG